jgi:ACR3 family arsenite efflux pump ArsB
MWHILETIIVMLALFIGLPIIVGGYFQRLEQRDRQKLADWYNKTFNQEL